MKDFERIDLLEKKLKSFGTGLYNEGIRLENERKKSGFDKSYQIALGEQIISFYRLRIYLEGKDPDLEKHGGNK